VGQIAEFGRTIRRTKSSKLVAATYADRIALPRLQHQAGGRGGTADDDGMSPARQARSEWTSKSAGQEHLRETFKLRSPTPFLPGKDWLSFDAGIWYPSAIRVACRNGGRST